ncbi:MAG: ABC transporter substrate-binding protein [Devosia sp.]|nr:ABC transporter substrate-binding protein [Devosia sp.]
MPKDVSISDDLLAAGLTRRGALRLGAAALAGMSALSLSSRFAFAAGEQVLMVAHPLFDQDWSPLRGGGTPFRWNSLWWASAAYFDADNKLHPYVFASWQGSTDAKTWTFKLDPKAVFSDGSPITAADVKGSWEVAAMPATKSARVAQVLSGVVGYADVSVGKGSTLAGVATPDAGTVVVTLEASDPVFFERVANHIVPITKASAVRGSDGNEIQDWFTPGKNAVYSGPFKLTSIDIDQGVLTFEPNEHFFGPKPKLTRVEIHTVEDPVTATALIKSGKYNAHSELTTSTIIQDLGKEFAAGPIIPTSQHFWFNQSRKPFDDPKVRQALILAIDRDGMFKASYPDGPHMKADQILNSVPGADNSGFTPYPYDPAAAKKLLAESSYGGPERLPKIMMAGISGPAIEAAAQFIAEQWRQNLGITAVDMKPQEDNYSGPDQGSVQVFRNDVGTRVPDAISYLAGCIASDASTAKKEMGGYKNATVDAKLVEGATKAVDDPARVKLAQEAQQAFHDDYMFIPWYAQAMSRWATAAVKNIDKNLDWQVISPWDVSIG